MSGPAIVFLLSHARHARMWRRVNRIAPGFHSSRVFAFDRRLETPAHHGAYVSLGTISHRNYLARLRVLVRAVGTIRRAATQAEAVYCFSLDLLALAWIATAFSKTPPRLAYEVADIRDALAGSGLLSRILRWIERALVRRCSVVVFTSAHFYEGYFRQVQRLTGFRHVVIEHKPELAPALRDGIAPRRDWSLPVTIGYFGIIKSPASFRLLAGLAEAGGGAIRVLFRGIFVPPLDASACLAEISASPHMVYDGPYKSPEDLPSLYGSVDLIWDAYNETANSKWQRTTRFSEALFFKRPLLVNPDTQDGSLALRFGVGMPVDVTEPAESIRKILAISHQDYLQWYSAFDRVPDSMIFYGDEYVRLHAELLGASPAPHRERISAPIT